MTTLERVVKTIKRAPWIWEAISATDQWWSLLLAYGGVKQLTFPHTVRFRDGSQVALQDKDEVGVLWHIFFGRCYRVEPEDRVIVDGGANIGMFCLWAARRAKAATIISVEPFPATFDRLTALVRDNRLQERVTPVNAALGGTEGTRVMESDNRSSVNFHMASAGSNKAGVPVKCVRLESLFTPLGQARVSLLKMDVEGSEFEVLLAAAPELLRRCDRMDVEVHHPGEEGRKLRAQLTEHLAAAGLKLVAMDLDKQDCGLMRFSQQGQG